MNDPVNIFWFRRDLRLNDNKGLFKALQSGLKVLPVFIFDKHILNHLPGTDKRVLFIYNRIQLLNQQLAEFGASIAVYYGNPEDVFTELISLHHIREVFSNRDYEPYALQRDRKVEKILEKSGTGFTTFKDQVLFEAGEILKSDGKPYVVFSPYKRKWLEKMNASAISHYDSISLINRLVNYTHHQIPSLEQMGFENGASRFPDSGIKENLIREYAETRDFPGLDSTTRLGLHLRFGTISIRECITVGKEMSSTWLSELIWREFFMQIMAHFPRVIQSSFRPEYDRIPWQNDELKFERWCEGKTGYPLVDAGMRELSQTGFMHNRVRMVVASFLTKHLLIDWRWGEAWFAGKLLDFELSSNNGNWQWAAGSGCDAAPYFRIFNPSEQAKKFDPEATYIKKWVPEFGTNDYPAPIVDHVEARELCLRVYREALKA